MDGLAEALEIASKQEHTLTQILTLAVEYEAKAITAERFADRCLQILRRDYLRPTKRASGEPGE